MEMDLSSRESILALIAEGQKYGEIRKVGKVIAEGGTGVTISSQSGWRMPALTAEQDEQLATTPTEELLSLPIFQPGNIRDTLHAYQMAKRPVTTTGH